MKPDHTVFLWGCNPSFQISFQFSVLCLKIQYQYLAGAIKRSQSVAINIFQIIVDQLA